jgi:lambda-carrageenase
MTKSTLILMTAALAMFICPNVIDAESTGIVSIETGYTICKVRTAVDRDGSYIVASSYEGTVLGLSYNGEVEWSNDLSGFMNRDLWCEDVTGDGSSEIFAANADGVLYCLDGKGKLLWEFKANDAPMNAVCVVNLDGTKLIVCGGYDTNIYYLTVQGELIKTIASSTYSREKAWGKPGEKRFPDKRSHIANFIRKAHGPGGEEILVVHGILNSNTTTGSIYFFEPMADAPFDFFTDLEGSKPYGAFSVSDINGDGVDEITLGTSTAVLDSCVASIDLSNKEQNVLRLSDLRRNVGGNGYRVAQTVSFGEPDEQQYLTSFGSTLIVSTADYSIENTEFLTCGYSFNDLWKDSVTGKILLGSIQSGGSCVHVLDTSVAGWKDAFTDLQPVGKLRTVLENTAIVREQLESFTSPPHGNKSRPVYLMTESLSGDLEETAMALEAEYGTPVFLRGQHMPRVEAWDRSSIGSEQYRERRDRRKTYSLTQEQALSQIVPLYDDERSGVSFWGGHGNDPYMFSTETMMKAVDASHGKTSVFIYPELEHYDDDFALVLKDHFYPMAEYFQGKDARIYVRTKHAFWQSIVYMPLWDRLLSGEFADVFVPSMEETTDKTMEQSMAGRLGIWTSGAVDQWGSRCARDNPSFDRLRQHSDQMLPNHFLRTQIYNIAYGATYQNNFPVDQEYFSILYELIAKGVLYVPNRNEIVSFNPVHLSMTEPDKHFLDEGNNAKWLTFYDEESERSNPMVFSRLNGSWPGAPVTEWDFSRYAADVRDRRLNFIPSYPNGLVLITPPQHGVFGDTDASRGQLTDHLHPLYINIMEEFITDGRNYISADGKTTYAANEYYRTVETAIENAVMKLPLTVSGNVGWVVAQTSPTHLRLTLVDGGYINPNDRTAIVQFHAVKPVTITDLLSGEEIDAPTPNSASIDVPCGLFRFLDIELEQVLEAGQ